MSNQPNRKATQKVACQRCGKPVSNGDALDDPEADPEGYHVDDQGPVCWGCLHDIMEEEGVAVSCPGAAPRWRDCSCRRFAMPLEKSMTM